LVLVPAGEAGAQADPHNFLFNSGQTIQPFFEGWAHNPDGSFEMHFGYLNRNYVEELHVPVGADNRITPDGPDHGQPTYFYPRTHNRVFSVTVPADWGDKRLVWQVTIRDETFRAEGWLQAEWEIFADPTRTFFAAAEGQAENRPPTLAVDAPGETTVGETLTMTATVRDDGLPEPRQFGGGQGPVPAFEPVSDGPTVPVNVPQIQTSARKRPTRSRVERVNVTWMQLRGPTGVSAESLDEAEAEDETEAERDASTLALAFASAGEYLFRVTASDGPLSVTEDVSITVR
jgi:hypothetical protein